MTQSSIWWRRSVYGIIIIFKSGIPASGLYCRNGQSSTVSLSSSVELWSMYHSPSGSCSLDPLMLMVSFMLWGSHVGQACSRTTNKRKYFFCETTSSPTWLLSLGTVWAVPLPGSVWAAPLPGSVWVVPLPGSLPGSVWAVPLPGSV